MNFNMVRTYSQEDLTAGPIDQYSMTMEVRSLLKESYFKDMEKKHFGVTIPINKKRRFSSNSSSDDSIERTPQKQSTAFKTIRDADILSTEMENISQDVRTEPSPVVFHRTCHFQQNFQTTYSTTPEPKYFKHKRNIVKNMRCVKDSSLREKRWSRSPTSQDNKSNSFHFESTADTSCDRSSATAEHKNIEPKHNIIKNMRCAKDSPLRERRWSLSPTSQDNKSDSFQLESTADTSYDRSSATAKHENFEPKHNIKNMRCVKDSPLREKRWSRSPTSHDNQSTSFQLESTADTSCDRGSATAKSRYFVPKHNIVKNMPWSKDAPLRGKRWSRSPTTQNDQSNSFQLESTADTSCDRVFDHSWNQSIDSSLDTPDRLLAQRPLNSLPWRSLPVKHKDSKLNQLTCVGSWRNTGRSRSSLPGPGNQKSEYVNVKESHIADWSAGVGFVDTHCHLDFIFRKLKFSGNFANFRRSCEQTEKFPRNFEGCVAIFCEPATFKKRTFWVRMLGNPSVWGSFGCHPHFADTFDQEAEDAMTHALGDDKAVALGEMGLDYSYKNNVPRDLQKQVLRQQITMAIERSLPIVIHCRDAHDDCLELCQASIPSDYPIHRHCFTDSWPEAQAWMAAFPRLKIGFTCLILNSNVPELRDVVRDLPLNKILLETDGPYFKPKCVTKMVCSHPGMAIYVAEEIADIKGASLDDVLIQIRKNTREIYSI